MVDKSISYRLSFNISVAVIIVFTAFIVAYFLFNQRLLRENIENKAIGLSSEVISVINREIITTKEVTASISEQINYYSRNGDEEKLLRQVVSKYPFLVSIEVYFDSAFYQPNHYHAIIQDGNIIKYIQKKQPDFSNQPEEDFFLKINDSVSPAWSAPYVWEVTEQIVVSYFHPISEPSDSGFNITGNIIAKFSLTDFNAALNHINDDRPGYTCIVDKNGNYLTHPEEKNILNANLFSVSPNVLSRSNININRIFEEQLKGSTVAYPSTLNNEKSWVYFSPIPESGWYLFFIMPYQELYHELYVVTFRMTIFALLGIVLIFFLVSYITRKQIEPLSNITSRLTSFSSPFKLNTKNEVKQVANSLEYLKVWFEQYQIARQKEELNNYKHIRDLHQASEIQQSLIKTSFPAFPDRQDIDLYAIYKPAQIVSGDLFDYYFLDEDNLLFTIGDVSGKGIPAAIFMSVCQTVIKNNSYYRYPHKIVEKANSELCTSNNHQYFLTLFLGIMNVKTGVLTYCNAAHTFPLIINSAGKLTEIKSTHGLPLGLYPEKEYEEDQIILSPGDSIILYTDGVFDALNEKNMLLGSKWFQKNLINKKNLSPQEIIELLDDDLEKIEISPKDDICMLAIKLLS